LISSFHKKTILFAPPSTWLHVEQSPLNLIILAGILAALFVFISLFICLICRIKYKLKRRKEENSLTTTNLNNIHSMSNEKNILQQHHQQHHQTIFNNIQLMDNLHVLQMIYILNEQQFSTMQ